MRDDTPAALPLIAFVAGLALGLRLSDAAALVLVAILLCGLRRIRLALACLAVAGGIATAAHQVSIREAGDRALARFPADRFTEVIAPLSRDWAGSGDGYVLRCDRFRAGGVEFARPLTIYSRFPPTPIGMQGSLRAQGFLRRSLRGESILSLKSPRLLTYGADRKLYLPSTWNRILVMRLRPFAPRFPVEVALSEAIALGHGEHLDEAIRTDYRRGGTYHLLVFSGLQIALAALILSRLLSALRAPRVADWVLLFLSLLAPLFIGPSASVSRATVGLGLYAFSRILHRPTTVENLWCLAALVRLILVPADLGEAAFHLTFAGSGAMLFIARPWAAGRLRWGTYALAAEAAITPLTLFHFHQYALGGSVMTMLMTPLIFVMLCLGLIACAVPCPALFHCLGALHAVCGMLNGAVAPVSGFFSAPSAAALIGSGVLALAVIAVTRGARRSGALLMLCSIPVFSAVRAARQDVAFPQLTVLDVGQGDALLLRTPGHAVLIDSGGRMGDDRFGEMTLLPMLLDRGVRKLDTAVLTHAHPDHCGGMPAVVSSLAVKQMWISTNRFRGPCAASLLDAAAASETPLHLIRDGDVQSFAGMRLTMRLAGRRFKHSPENNASVVTEAVLGTRNLLLTGDIEGDAEETLASRLRPATVLKVAHHGSRTSSSAELLDAVRPAIALISCGRANLFGHPHRSVLEGLRHRGIQVWRTDRNGSIEVDFRGAHVFVHPEIDTPR